MNQDQTDKSNQGSEGSSGTDSIESGRGKRVAKALLFTTLGPRTMVRQSIGSNIGKTLRDLAGIWAQANHAASGRKLSGPRPLGDFEAVLRAAGQQEKRVLQGYRRQRVVLGAFWLLLLACLNELISASNLLTIFICVIAVASMFVVVFATAMKQAMLREKYLFTPSEYLLFVAAKPWDLLPLGIPKEWRLYTGTKPKVKVKKRA